MKEIIVLTPNRPGVLAELASLLVSAGVNIESFSVEGSAGDGAIQFRVDRYDDALHTLTQAGYHAYTEEAVLIRLEDKPGTLARLASRLNDSGIDIRSLRIVTRGPGGCLAAIVTDKMSATRELLHDILIGGPPSDDVDQT